MAESTNQRERERLDEQVIVTRAMQYVCGETREEIDPRDLFILRKNLRRSYEHVHKLTAQLVAMSADLDSMKMRLEQVTNARLRPHEHSATQITQITGSIADNVGTARACGALMRVRDGTSYIVQCVMPAIPAYGNKCNIHCDAGRPSYAAALATTHDATGACASK